MGFMDKVKQQAEQAMATGNTDLLRALGTAYYAQQRQGGPADAVTSALAALDAAAEDGPIDTAPTTAPKAPTVPTGTPTGDFTL
jgi:hypothetical protein